MSTQKTKYKLTDEHRAMLPAWRDKWIANAMSTKPMDREDRAIMVTSIKGMYAAANLAAPKILFVPSPFVLRFAGGFAAGLIHLGKKPKAAAKVTTRTEQVSSDWYYMSMATVEATIRATQAILSDEKSRPIVPKDDHSPVATRTMLDVAKSIGGDDYEFLVQCAQNSYSMWSGGNQWSGTAAPLSFFRHVAKLDIDWSKWAHWEEATIHGGPRIMHKDFCMVSDRPIKLTVDEAGLPHCPDGPFCRWSDGSSIYAIHGVRVPWWVVEHPDRITLKHIGDETNVEIRRVMIDRYGQLRYLEDSNAKVVHTDDFGVLYEVPLSGDQPLKMVKVVNSTLNPDGTAKDYFIPVPPDMVRARQAVAWTFSMAENDYNPEIES